MLTRLILLLLVIMQSLSLSHGAESKPAWQVDWEKSLAAAKREGEVRLWGDQEITLCCMKAPVAKEISPLAMWDLHFLRHLDNSGFIDNLYQSA